MYLNSLVAYPYMSKNMITALKAADDAGRLRLIVDSGAFTAWKANKPIALDDYCRMIESLPFKPWRYFSLDVIGDPKGSLRNYEIMLARGFNPVPVFTRGEDPSVLDDYYKTSDLVGIGGLVGTYKNKGYVKWLMDRVAGRNVHLLGFTDMRFVRYYKPYSCDSSTVETGKRYAAFSVFDKDAIAWVKVSKKDFIQKPSPHLYQLIESYNIKPEDLAKNENWVGGTNPAVDLAYKSHLRASFNYEKKIGVKYFLAVATSTALNDLRRLHIKEQLE